jgi:NACalpha-BTF3-like transcription factor
MADNNKEAAGQLDIQTQINKVLQQRTGILKNQAKFLSAQTQTAMEMCKALDCEGLDGMKDRLAEIQDGLAEAAEEAKNLEGSASSAGSTISRIAKKGTKEGGLMSKVFSPMGGMFAGLGVGMVSAFKGATNMIGGFLSSGKRVIGIIGSIGKSLITLPFSLLNNLTSFAAGAGGGVSALRQAMEDLKETFGSLASNEGKAVMTGFKNMRKQSQSLGGSGIRMARIFGPGQEGLGAALKSVGEQLTDLGPMMTKFSGEVQNNAGVFEVYRRGLGLTGDNFKSLGTLASTTGQSLESTLDQVGSQAINMGKQFGISSKLIAGDMASMLGDVANYGTLSIKQVSSLAVYTRKLGIEAKELNGVIDSWDNFEDAAAGASKLSQAFGMNIDAMQMMNEQDPGKRMDMLRESFQATGKSVEDLSRQELKLLAAQMGLSEEAAKKALSSDMDYDDIVAGSEDAEAKTISQAEAMKELADAMKQTFGGGGQGPKTFMEALVQGFERGIMRGKGMRKMFRNIRGALKETYRFGRDLGKMFIEMFPGIQDMVKGLTDLFDPRRFARLRRDLLGAFRNLFRDIRTDPQAGVETFTKRIKEIFANFFNGAGGAGKQFMEGLKTFGKTVGVLILSLLPIMMRGLASLIGKLADFIRDPSAFTDAASGLGDGLSQALGAAWQNVVDTWPILRDAFYDLWDAVAPELGKLWKVIWPYILGAVIFKTVLAVAANMTLGAVWGVLLKGFKSLFGGAMSAGAAQGTEEGQKKMQRGGGFIDTIKTVIEKAANLNATQIAKAALNMGLLIAFLAGSVILFAYALREAVGVVSEVDNTKLAIMAGVLVGTMLAMPGIAAAAEGMKSISWTQMASALGKTALIMLGMAGVTWVLGNVINCMEDVSIGKIKNFFLVMGAAMLGALVAIGLSIPVGMLANKFGKEITTGLLVLGAVMIGLGGVGWVIGKMLGTIPNPEKVAALMDAISTLVRTTAMMIPIAGGLGLMLMAFPFGTAGVGIIIAGFGLLSTLVGTLTAGVMPTIREIAAMQISNPERVKTVVQMIVDVINAIANFTGQFARVLESLKPPPEAGADQMAKNIAAAKDLLDALLENGINKVIEMMINLVTGQAGGNLTGLGIQAASAIAGVLNAVAAIMGAFSPSVIGDIANSQEGIDNDEVDSVLQEMTNFTNAVGPQIRATLDTIAKHFLDPTLLGLMNGMNSNSIQFIKAMTPLFSALGDISKAMQPDPAVLSAMAGGSEGHDNDEWANTIRAMGSFASTMGRSLSSVMASMTPVMKGVIEAVGKMINSIPPGNEEKIKAVAGLIGPIFTALGSMMSGVFPIINSVLKGSQTRKGKIDIARLNAAAKSMKTIFGAVGNLMTQMGPPMSKMIREVITIANGIEDPEALAPKIDIISTSIDAIKNLMDMFNPDTNNVFSSFMSSADEVQYTIGGEQVSMLSAAIFNMERFTSRVLGSDGPLQDLITALGNIAIDDTQAANIKKITPGLEALEKIFNFVKIFRELDTTGTGDLEGIANNMNSTFEALAGVQWTGDQNSLESLLESVGSGDWDYSNRRLKSRAEGIVEFGNFITEFNRMMPEFDRAVVNAQNSAALTTSDPTMYNAMVGLQNVFETVANGIQPEIQQRFIAASTAVRAMLENYAELNNLLATIGPLDIEANLTRFGQSMAVSTDTINIENKPINITVNFNVTMDANQIALALSDASRPGGSNTVQLSRQGGSPVGGEG